MINILPLKHSQRCEEFRRRTGTEASAVLDGSLATACWELGDCGEEAVAYFKAMLRILPQMEEAINSFCQNLKLCSSNTHRRCPMQLLINHRFFSYIGHVWIRALVRAHVRMRAGRPKFAWAVQRRHISVDRRNMGNQWREDKWLWCEW
jgi:hypothetical protein